MQTIAEKLITLALQKRDLWHKLDKHGDCQDLADSVWNEYLGVIEALATVLDISMPNAYAMVLDAI